MKEKLLNAYKGVKTGNPLDKDTLCGPLSSELSLQIYENGLKEI